MTGGDESPADDDLTIEVDAGEPSDADPGADEPASGDAEEKATEAAGAGDPSGGSDDGPSEAPQDVDAGPRERMERALEAVRREGQKAAAIYAVVDAVAAFLLVNVLLAVAAPPGVPEPVAIAGVAGVAVLAGELWLRTRGSLVERFEGANPEIAGALRTACDAAGAGADTRMAARLYEETLERLRETSGLALVDSRRLAATALVIVVLCLASVQVTVVGVSVFGTGDPAPDVEDQPEAVTPGFDGLRDGGEVLGDPSSVDRGDDNVSAGVETNEGDGPVDEQRTFPADGGGSAAGAAVETQQAAFSDPERIENAELVREYNVRIREDE